MAVNNMRAPTFVGDTIRENGVDFISWDGSAWFLYENNQDNPMETPGASAENITVADVIIGNIPTGSGTTANGNAFITYTFQGQTWYRILTSPETVTTTDPR